MQDQIHDEKEVQRLGRAYRNEAIRLASELDTARAQFRTALTCLSLMNTKLTQVIEELSGGENE
jgi:hypothetical protein